MTPAAASGAGAFCPDPFQLPVGVVGLATLDLGAIVSPASACLRAWPAGDPDPRGQLTHQQKSGAGGRTRTGTAVKGGGILSPLCLPFHHTGALLQHPCLAEKDQRFLRAWISSPQRGT